MAAKDVSKEEAELICAISKTAECAEWVDGTTRGSLRLAMGIVCDPPRRGLHVEVYLHRGHKVLRRTIDFGLWDSSSGIAERVYQLTVADSNTPAHMERGVQWFGSHEHFGDVRTQRPELDEVSFGEALAVFCGRISLDIDGDIDDPAELKLF